MQSNGLEAHFAIPVAARVSIASNRALPVFDYYVSVRGEVGLDRGGGI
jgi:hypothetical protein